MAVTKIIASVSMRRHSILDYATNCQRKSKQFYHVPKFLPKGSMPSHVPKEARERRRANNFSRYQSLAGCGE
jgi:hypothetical protein